MNQELIFSHLTGRNRTGSEPGGTLIHAILGDGVHHPTFRKALCGAKPGRRSNGWSEATEDHATCPKCLKKLEKLEGGESWRSVNSH